MFRELFFIPVLPSLLLLLYSCDGSTNAEKLQKLFSPEGAEVTRPAPITFAFWVNGDADHFVPTKSTDSSGGLSRADSIEVKRIRQLAEKCENCNVLIFHGQRGGARWYTANAPWATYFWVYVRGELKLERHVDQINNADPLTLTALLKFTDRFFSNSERHLIYRGHSFIPAYDPKNNEGTLKILPFAYGFPDSPYGPQQFVESFKNAQLVRPLESVTLAACSMASLDLALALEPYSKFLLAPEVNILETLSVSFRFSFLSDPNLGKTIPVAETTAARILEEFDETPEAIEAMMEYPMTKIQLVALGAIKQDWQTFMDGLAKEILGSGQKSLTSDLRAKSVVMRVVSERFVRDLRKKGKSEETVQGMIQFVREPGADPNQLDVGKFLEVVSVKLPSLEAEARRLKGLIQQSQKTYRLPIHSEMSGMSFRFLIP